MAAWVEFRREDIRVLAGITAEVVRLLALLLLGAGWAFHPLEQAATILLAPVILITSRLYCQVLFAFLVVNSLASLPAYGDTPVVALAAAVPFWACGRLVGREGWVARQVARHARLVRALLAVAGGCALCLFAHRYVTWWTPFLYAALLFLTRQAVPRPERAKSGPWLPNVLLAAVSVAVTLAMGEVAARYLHSGRPMEHTNVYEYHPQAAFTLQPGSDSPHYRRIGRDTFEMVPTSISSQGLRDHEYGPRAPHEFRVFVLGDSFTMGWALEVELGYVEVLERGLRRKLSTPVSVLNGGCGAYGPWQELYFLEERGFPREPCLVLHQLFVANDVQNTLSRTGRYLESYHWQSESDFIRWRNHGAWPIRVEDWFKANSGLYRTFLRASDSRDLLSHWLWKVRFVPEPAFFDLPRSAARTSNLEVSLRHWYPLLEEGWREFERDVLRIKHLCEARGIEYAAFAIPVQSDISDPAWTLATQALGEAAYERGKDVRLTEEFFAREGITYIPLLDAMLRANRDGLYYPMDGHLTAEGAAVVADRLEQFILDRYFGEGCVPACTAEFPPAAPAVP